MNQDEAMWPKSQHSSVSCYCTNRKHQDPTIYT